MGHISSLPNKLHPTGIQLNSIKVTSVGHRRGAAVARSHIFPRSRSNSTNFDVLLNKFLKFFPTYVL